MTTHPVGDEEDRRGDTRESSLSERRFPVWVHATGFRRTTAVGVLTATHPHSATGSTGDESVVIGARHRVARWRPSRPATGAEAELADRASMVLRARRGSRVDSGGRQPGPGGFRGQRSVPSEVLRQPTTRRPGSASSVAPESPMQGRPTGSPRSVQNQCQAKRAPPFRRAQPTHRASDRPPATRRDQPTPHHGPTPTPSTADRPTT